MIGQNGKKGNGSGRLAALSELLAEAYRGFDQARGAEAAAAISYYALFSLFPFLLILAAAGSILLESLQAETQLISMADQFFPAAADLIGENLHRLFVLRTPVSMVALAGLLWSATGVFSGLAGSVDRAFGGRGGHPFWRWRLVALGMAALFLAGLLLLVQLSTGALLFLSQGDHGPWLTPIFRSLVTGLPYAVLSLLLPWFLVLAVSFLLYLWAPASPVAVQDALLGALFSASAWLAGKYIFLWYLEMAFSRYQLIYGSLGTVIALMLWVYCTGLILLVGAHLGAAAARCRSRR